MPVISNVPHYPPVQGLKPDGGGEGRGVKGGARVTSGNASIRLNAIGIHSAHEMAVVGDLSPETVTAKIAGGGCDLKLIDQNGNIDILKGK